MKRHLEHKREHKRSANRTQTPYLVIVAVLAIGMSISMPSTPAWASLNLRPSSLLLPLRDLTGSPSLAVAMSTPSPTPSLREGKAVVDHDNDPATNSNEGIDRAPATWGRTVLGRTVDAYIDRLVSSWEVLRQAGDFDFRFSDNTDMKLKLRDALDNPEAVIVVTTAF